MKPSSGRSAPRSGASPGGMVWPKVSVRRCAGCPRSAAELGESGLSTPSAGIGPPMVLIAGSRARSVEELRYIGGVGWHTTGNLEIGDPDHVACVDHFILLIEHEKDVDRDGFRGTKGDGVAWLERSDAAVDARLDEEGGIAADVFRQLATQLIGAGRQVRELDAARLVARQPRDGSERGVVDTSRAAQREWDTAGQRLTFVRPAVPVSPGIRSRRASEDANVNAPGGSGKLWRETDRDVDAKGIEPVVVGNGGGNELTLVARRGKIRSRSRQQHAVLTGAQSFKRHGGASRIETAREERRLGQVGVRAGKEGEAQLLSVDQTIVGEEDVDS